MGATVHLGADADKVARVLRAIAAATADRRLRGTAARCAGRVRRSMDRRELQRVVWLLRTARRDTSLPRAEHRAAVYWSAHLRGRT
jgi:hypothetical protein